MDHLEDVKRMHQHLEHWLPSREGRLHDFGTGRSILEILDIGDGHFLDIIQIKMIEVSIGETFKEDFITSVRYKVISGGHIQ